MISYYYGGVQIILGLVIAIPSLTIGTSVTTVALLIALLLTGLYSVLGSKYLRDTQHNLETRNSHSLNGTPHPDEFVRFSRLHIQFLYVSLATAFILIGLGLASFIQGSLAYFNESDGMMSSGSTPAISGIAALLVNLFICGLLLGDLRRTREQRHLTGRPRSRTPRSGRPIEVWTIDQRLAETFPPAYSQFDLAANKGPDENEPPPPYLSSIAVDNSNIASTNAGTAIYPEHLTASNATDGGVISDNHMLPEVIVGDRMNDLNLRADLHLEAPNNVTERERTVSSCSA